jgi:hypothetical protein
MGRGEGSAVNFFTALDRPVLSSLLLKYCLMAREGVMSGINRKGLVILYISGDVNF